MERTTYDTLIVGARTAGATTALLLASSGARVLVVDRAAPGTDTMSTHALTRAGTTQLARLGLLADLRAAGTPAITRSTLHYAAESLPLAIRPDAHIDGLVAPRRTVLDPMIADAARSAGAEIAYEFTLRDLVVDVTGRVIGAVVIGPDGRTTEIAARVVIGADGRRSTVARRVGAPVLKRARNAAAHAYTYLAGLEDDGTHLHFREGIGVGVMPTNGELHCIVASMKPEAFLSQRRALTSEEGFRAFIARDVPELRHAISSARIVQRPVGFSGEHGYIRRSHGPGWALVGDASYFKDPVTAHGMTDALRDAELLAEAVLRGGDAALATYQAVRDALAAELFAVTDEIAAMSWTLDELKALHLRLNQALKHEQAWIASRCVSHQHAA